jgi:hypothetical protein
MEEISAIENESVGLAHVKGFGGRLILEKVGTYSKWHRIK